MPPKISYRYADSERSFSTVPELRDALLGSYPGAACLGARIVLINRDGDPQQITKAEIEGPGLPIADLAPIFGGRAA